MPIKSSPPQRNCRQPADCESKGVALTKAPDGQVDRETLESKEFVYFGHGKVFSIRRTSL